jgi:hypothetical protein
MLAGTLEQANVRNEACLVGTPSAPKLARFEVSLTAGQQNPAIVPSRATEFQFGYYGASLIHACQGASQPATEQIA